MVLANNRSALLRHEAVTLIELIVVAAVIALLLALLLPAITSAREAARRARCLGNLHELGIGLGQYQDRQGCWPPGRVASYDPRFIGFGLDALCRNGYVDKSLHLAILPDIEQTTLFNTINQSLSIFSQENTTCHRVVISMFACPSDPTAGVARAIRPDALVLNQA